MEEQKEERGRRQCQLNHALQSLRMYTHACMHTRLICAMVYTLRGQLCAWAREPEVDDGALYLSLCMLSVSLMEVYGGV